MPVFIGCAGWSIPGGAADLFPEGGSHLERYAQRLNAVEINSSFYRPHQFKTYARWGAATPVNFRFSVKIPKLITHEHRLRDVDDLLDRFASEVNGLGEKLGPLLVQLPPSLRMEMGVAGTFFQKMRDRFHSAIVCEPRHATWFTSEVSSLFLDYHVGRVVADPAPVPAAAVPDGWPGVQYYRLHGSPRIYYSEYAAHFLERLAGAVATASLDGVEAWCIFDNTAAGAAVPNAFGLQENVTTLLSRD